MKNKILLLIIIIISILLIGCSAKTSEGSCMAACKDSHNCYYYGEDISLEKKEKECNINCWNSCYSHIINKTTMVGK